MKGRRELRFDTSLLELRTTPFVPHDPTPRQAAFLLLECLEAFYGGAGGGGKSDALLMAALYYADIPGYNALIIRRSLADLAMPSALMDRAHEWLGRRADARWDRARSAGRLPAERPSPSDTWRTRATVTGTHPQNFN